MKIALLFPPLGSITHPYSSLPCLTGQLRSRGHEVTQCDLGMRVIDSMLTPRHLGELHQSIRARIKRISGPGQLLRSRRRELRLLLAADLAAPDVIEKIDHAKTVLRSKELFYQPEQYLHATILVRRALEIVSAAHFPTRITYNELVFGMRPTLENVYQLAGDERRNPFLKVMREQALPATLPEVPGFVGISITYNQQLAAGYALARLIKDRSPETHVSIGGAALVLAEPRLRDEPRAFDWADSYVFGEGETALASLVEAVEAGGPLDLDLENAYLAPDSGAEPRPVTSIETRTFRENFKELPSPDYAGLNLEDFLSPETVFLLANSRGCYYRKCAFCNVSLGFKHQCQERPAAAICSDLESLAKKHDARFVFFSDDGMTHRRREEISRLFAQAGPGFYWQTTLRYDKRLDRDQLGRMYDSGCRQLSFGQESGDQRVLDLMRKGTRLEVAREVIKNASEAGMAVHLNTFLGFPGETREEARSTINFLADHRQYVTSFSMRPYMLTEFSPVHLSPEDFAVTNVRVHTEGELIPELLFDVTEGMSQEETREAFAEAVTVLKPLYPRIDAFLDSSLGAHSLLYLAATGRTKAEDVFRVPELPEDFTRRRPRLAASVVSRRLSRNSVYFYNPENGRKAQVDQRRSELLKLMDGERALEEILDQAFNEESKDRNSFLALVRHLFTKGLVELI